MSLAASAGAVAAAKIVALIIGALTTGQVLAAHRRPRTVFGVMAACGTLAQIAFFLPASGFAVAIGALVLWLFAFGGMSGTAWALMPHAMPQAGRGGVTSGLINQAISVVSFAAPSTYFALSGWSAYASLGCIGLALSLALLPPITVET